MTKEQVAALEEGARHSRILFVGQSPSRDSDPSRPFSGKCGRLLADFLDVPQAQMLADHDFTNLIDHYPGKGPSGDKFPMAEARVGAAKVTREWQGRRVILLGAGVARAMCLAKFAYFTAYTVKDAPGTIVGVIPHPSGVCRKYNDPDVRLEAAKFLRQFPDIKV